MAENDVAEIDTFGKVTKPTLYKPEMLNVIREAASNGIVNREIAKGLGIAESTLYEWKKAIPEVAEAFQQGEEWLINDVKNSLYKSAKGYEYSEVTEENGAVKKVVTKHMPGNVVAQQVILYNKRPDEFKAKNHDSDQNITIKLEIPQAIQEIAQLDKAITDLEKQLAVDVEAIPAD